MSFYVKIGLLVSVMSNHRIRSKSEGDTLRAGVISKFVRVTMYDRVARQNNRQYLIILIERTL